MKLYKIMPATILTVSLVALPSYASENVNKRAAYERFFRENITYVAKPVYQDKFLLIPEKKKLSDVKSERNGAFSMVKKSVENGIDNFIPNKYVLKTLNKFTKEVFRGSVHINEDGDLSLGVPRNILEIGSNVLLDEGKNFAADIIGDIETGNKYTDGFLDEIKSGIKSSSVVIKYGKIKPRLAYGKSVKNIDCGFANIIFDGGLISNNGFHETLGLGVSKKIGDYNTGVVGVVRFDGINQVHYDGIGLSMTRRDKKATVKSGLNIKPDEIKFSLSAKF